MSLLGGIIVVALIALFIIGEIKIAEEDQKYFEEFGVYPSHEGWD